MSAWILGALLLLTAGPAAGDSWAGPQIREVFSESREFFVRVRPGASLGDTVGFAGAKKGKYATAEFYRRAPDRSYRLASEVSLLNPVAPVEVLVGDNGHLVALDNWHNLGYGKVVSIYDSRGTLIRSYALGDLFQADEIKAFAHSISSIHWRKGPIYVQPDQKTAFVTVKEGADLLIGLETGTFKYCETRDKAYRCRGSVELTR